MTDISTTCTDVISSKSSQKLLSVDDVKSGPLKLIGQCRRDVIGCNTHVKLANSN